MLSETIKILALFLAKSLLSPDDSSNGILFKSSNKITFEVDSVQKATKRINNCNWEDTIQTKLGNQNPFEAFYTPPKDVDCVSDCVDSSTVHGFLLAVHIAYSHHYPLSISPDHIWLCIIQAYSTYVNMPDEGDESIDKTDIKVRRDNFTKGSPDNYWPGVFSEFSNKIREYIGSEAHDLLVPSFTTTTEVERAAAEVVLMETFKKYFNYIVLTACGIPEITLQGTVQDWRKLRENVMKLHEDVSGYLKPFPSQWITKLEPILNEFVSTAEGNVNKKFWSGIYKYITPGSGSACITGWILELFPLVEKKASYSCSKYDKDTHEVVRYEGATSDDFPSGITSVPFTWRYYCTEYKMNFYAGFIGVSQDPESLTVSPEIGWIVGDKPATSSQNHSIGFGDYFYSNDRQCISI